MTTNHIAAITAMITAIATLVHATAALISAMRNDRSSTSPTGGADDSVRERERSADGDE